MKNVPFRNVNDDDTGQIMGIPLYILLIVIIAAVSLAAILGFMVTSSPTIDRIQTMVDQGASSETKVVCDTIESDGTAHPSGKVNLQVKVIDENGDPVQNVDVHAEGAGVNAVGTTNESGMIPAPRGGQGGFEISGSVYLPPNVDSDKIVIKAERSGTIGTQSAETSVWVTRG